MAMLNTTTTTAAATASGDSGSLRRTARTDMRTGTIPSNTNPVASPMARYTAETPRAIKLKWLRPMGLPRPYLPAGLRLDSQEGAGEVQTPLLGPAADSLRIGDKVWMRHAKAGELCERFSELHLVDGESVVAAVPTYRGEGQCFG